MARRRPAKKSRVERSAQAQEDLSTTRTPSKFQTLPNELLYMIRDCLPKKNLRDHIALQSTCRELRILYEKAERFWETACHAYGVSRPAPSEEFLYSKPRVTWRELAIAIVNHQECCDITTCRQWDLPGTFRIELS